MTEEEAKKAVKEDIEAIAKASDDQEDKLTAMLVGFSDLLVNQTVHGHRGEASEKELAICAMAGLIKTLIDYDKLKDDLIALNKFIIDEPDNTIMASNDKIEKEKGIFKENDSYGNSLDWEIEKLDEITECHLVSGDFDYLIKARLGALEDYHDLLCTLHSYLPGVVMQRSYVVMEELKETHYLRA